MRRAKDINDSLPDLLLGILVFGLLAEVIPVWFLEDKAGYTAGLVLGIAAAMLMAWHMAWSLDRAFDLDEEGAVHKLQRTSVLRYGGLMILLGVLIMTGIGSPIAAFVGAMGLKVSAYLAPFTHKIFRR